MQPTIPHHTVATYNISVHHLMAPSPDRVIIPRWLSLLVDRLALVAAGQERQCHRQRYRCQTRATVVT